MKICSTCNIEKELSEFNRRKRTHDIGYTSKCKPCSRAYSMEHYNNNTAYYIQKAGRNTRKRKDKMSAFFIEHFKYNPCVDCGETDPVVLQFDHVVGEKLHNISTMAIRGNDIEDIKTEMTKCVTRCANCHIRKTAKEYNWSILRSLNKDVAQ